MSYCKSHNALVCWPRCWSAASGFRSFAAVVVLTLLALANGYGAGTPAGTVIATQATASFHDGKHSTLQVVGSNRVDVMVGQIAVVNIFPSIASKSARVNSPADYAFRVVNSGNGADNLVVSPVSSLHLPVGVYRDLDRNGVLTSDEVAAGSVSATGLMPADSGAYLIGRVNIPNDIALNGQSDLLSVTVSSGFNPMRSAMGLYTTSISSASMSATKSVDVTSPRAGDRVTYTITYANVGNAEATNVTMSDILDGNLRFVTGSATPVPVSIVGQTIVWDFGTMAAQESRTLIFTADVVNNVPPTTEIHNMAVLRSFDGSTEQQVITREVNYIIVRSGGVVTVDVSRDREFSAEPGDTVQYGFVITNNGVQPETFNLSTSSTQNIGWVLYRDDNANGLVDNGEGLVSTTGPLSGGGGQIRIVARARIPMVTADLTVDVMTLRVASTVNADNFVTRLGSTTVQLPVVTLAKELRANTPVPGSEITYTITYANHGHGSAYQFVMLDRIPQHTIYVAGSARHNGAGKTDAQDGDEVTVLNGVVTAQLGTLRPATSGTIEFKVRIQ